MGVESLRKLIREAVWQNHHLMDLPGTIRMSADFYIKSPHCNCFTVEDINNGLCMDFAEFVVEKCGGETNDLFAIDETSFYVDTQEEAHENGWADVVATNDGGCWNKEMLDRYGYPKGGVSEFHLGFHAWIIHKRKHYDAEAPDGVSTPWELPCFKRMAAREGLLHEDDEIEYEEEDFSHLKDEAHLNSLFPLLVAAAQKEYDEWEQDEDGIDVVLGSGGVCQDIASAMASVMSSNGIDCSEVCQSQGEQHVYCICKIQEGVYEVDISPYVYETGGGYNWRKIPGVKFDVGHLSVRLLSHDPNEFEAFTEEW